MRYLKGKSLLIIFDNYANLKYKTESQLPKQLGFLICLPSKIDKLWKIN